MSSGTDMRLILRDTLLQYGRALTISMAIQGEYDPETGQTAPATTLNVDGLARVGDYRDGVIDGTLIQTGDRRVTWQPIYSGDTNSPVLTPHDDDSPFDDETEYSQDNLGAFVPNITDTIEIDGKVYAIMNVKKRELEGDWISYTLQVR
jgi:hypothetical protein